MAEEMSASIQKGLSEWWSEESEYLFRRIERWAACARGYNRLKSIRISRARMTMKEKPHDDLYWCGSSTNNYSLRRSRSPDETRRINCCGGTFNYQSNSYFNSTCLDTYRYDHSIYFKTIGDIKNSKRKLNNNINENNLQHEVENDEHKSQYYSCYNNNNLSDEFNTQVQDNNDSESSSNIELNNDNAQVNVVTPNGDVRWDYLYTNTRENFDDTEIITSSYNNIWPIVDLSMITENLSLDLHRDLHQYNNDDNENNNSSQVLPSSSSIINQQPVKNIQDSSFTKMLNFRKQKKSSNILPHSIIVSDDNNITCVSSSVHFNCTNDTKSPALSASYQHYRPINAK
ncbi:hypothetical protein PV327_005539 [Microctonus hyperodae]|uniref:Uncharacterized protein n=1 Tax=Microctonus hyperodae TaxID=165561 RepID=A0AA39G1K3_MICHY|nr:hypothetical protein PV327_005539 [Microctonus hyperodae]